MKPSRRNKAEAQPVPADDFAGSALNLSRLRKELKPFKLHWFPRLRSTNDHAAALRRRGKLFAPAVVLAGRQTAGRGRGTNVWWSETGCLTVTLALPIDEQIAPHQLPLIAGLSVRNAMAQLSGCSGVLLKWPNDLLFEDRKFAGLLCERISGADLVGIGVNLNVDVSAAPAAVRARMTTLSGICNRPIDPTVALLEIISHLRAMLIRAANRPIAELLREYDSHHALIGRQVSISNLPDPGVISGKCQGLDSQGRLIVADGRNTHRIISGQVALR